jgi:hypothetical protein
MRFKTACHFSQPSARSVHHHALPENLFDVYINIILQSMPRYSKWSLSSRFPIKPFYAPFLFPYLPRPSPSSWFPRSNSLFPINTKKFWWLSVSIQTVSLRGHPLRFPSWLQIIGEAGIYKSGILSTYDRRFLNQESERAGNARHYIPYGYIYFCGTLQKSFTQVHETQSLMAS